MISPSFHFLSKRVSSLVLLITIVGLLFGSERFGICDGFGAERPIASVAAVSAGQLVELGYQQLARGS